jgi:hypothetical protein
MVTYRSIVPHYRAINHDPVRHSDPDVFTPERYINDTTNAAESAALSDATKRGILPFKADIDNRPFHFRRGAENLQRNSSCRKLVVHPNGYISVRAVFLTPQHAYFGDLMSLRR